MISMAKRKMKSLASGETLGVHALVSLDTASLVEHAVRGHEGAFEMLMHRYSPLVISFLYSRAGNLADAEDLSQEVFLAAFRHLNQLKRPEHFHAWLMRIAKAKFVDFCRRNARRPVEVRSLGDEISDQTSENSPDPSQLAQLRQVQQIILNEINNMGEKHRSILYWRLIRNESPTEVADRLGLSPKAVSVVFFRGLRLLRTALEKFGIHPSERG